jgi:hypothetical protein
MTEFMHPTGVEVDDQCAGDEAREPSFENAKPFEAAVAVGLVPAVDAASLIRRR